MQIVIEIPKDAYDYVMGSGYFPSNFNMISEIRNGTVLEPCDDAISREDAEQMFRNIRSHLKPQDYKSAEEFNTRDLMLLNAEQMIHALPSVTQKSGKWLKSIDYIGNVKCSICQKEYDQDVLYDAKYCPNCGVKMESGNKE